MAISALADFKKTMAGKAAAAIVAAPLALASFGPAANDAHAGEPQLAATQPNITQEQAIAITEKARDMRKYSEDPDTRGIGVFINLQASAPMTGEQIGDYLRDQFADLNPPVPLEYRVNQSRGTATDVTFYVRGFDFTMTVTDIANEGLGSILAHHRGAWRPAQVSLNTQPQ